MVGTYLDRKGGYVTVSVERIRRGCFAVAKDRFSAPYELASGSVDCELATSGNALLFAECDVLMRGGLLGESGEGLVCARVLPGVLECALTDRRMERYLTVPAPREGGDRGA